MHNFPPPPAKNSIYPALLIAPRIKETKLLFYVGNVLGDNFLINPGRRDYHALLPSMLNFIHRTFHRFCA